MVVAERKWSYRLGRKHRYSGTEGIPAGGLTPGERADLVICDDDPFGQDSRVVQTWVGGRVVWHEERP